MEQHLTRFRTRMGIILYLTFRKTDKGVLTYSINSNGFVAGVLLIAMGIGFLTGHFQL